MTTLHISQVRISNVLGIDNLEFQPGQVTVVTGKNGQGKTSVLEALKAALRGGHDATLLRRGEQQGEIVLVLDDGTEIQKRITEAGSDTKVRVDGKLTTRPAEAIKGMADLLAVNPVEFLTSPADERVKVLLKTMPVVIDTGRMQAITGIRIDPSLASLGLPAIDAVCKQVFDARTGTNRAVKEKQATIKQLSDTLPEGIAEGIPDNADDLLAQLNGIDAAKDKKLAAIAGKLDKIRAEVNEAIQALQSEAQAKIEAIKAQLDTDVAAQRAALSETEAKASAAREAAIQANADARQGLADQIAAINEAQKQRGRYEQTRRTIQTMSDDLDRLKSEADQQTQALADLDAYKLELLSSLPIPGLEVRDGQIYRSGVHFDRLNTAQRVEIAVEIAKLRAKDLGVICLDGLELLDSEHFEALTANVARSGLQLFVTRVGDGAFQIETGGALVASEPDATLTDEGNMPQAAESSPVPAPAKTGHDAAIAHVAPQCSAHSAPDEPAKTGQSDAEDDQF